MPCARLGPWGRPRGRGPRRPGGARAAGSTLLVQPHARVCKELAWRVCREHATHATPRDGERPKLNAHASRSRTPQCTRSSTGVRRHADVYKMAHTLSRAAEGARIARPCWSLCRAAAAAATAGPVGRSRRPSAARSTGALRSRRRWPGSAGAGGGATPAAGEGQRPASAGGSHGRGACAAAGDGMEGW